MVSQYSVWYDGNVSDDYRMVLEDLKRVIASANEYEISLGKTKYYLIQLGNCTESSKKRILALFDTIGARDIKVEDRLDRNFGVVNGRKGSLSPVEQTSIELQILSENVTKLEIEYGFYLLKKCFSLPKLLYFLRISRF